MDLKSMLWHSKPKYVCLLSLTFRRFWFIFSKLSGDSSREYFERQVIETYRRNYRATMNIKVQNSNSRLMTTGSLSFFLIVFCFTLWYISRFDEPIYISSDVPVLHSNSSKCSEDEPEVIAKFWGFFNTIPLDDVL